MVCAGHGRCSVTSVAVAARRPIRLCDGDQSAEAQVARGVRRRKTFHLRTTRPIRAVGLLLGLISDGHIPVGDGEQASGTELS